MIQNDNSANWSTQTARFCLGRGRNSSRIILWCYYYAVFEWQNAWQTINTWCMIQPSATFLVAKVINKFNIHISKDNTLNSDDNNHTMLIVANPREQQYTGERGSIQETMYCNSIIFGLCDLILHIFYCSNYHVNIINVPKTQWNDITGYFPLYWRLMDTNSSCWTTNPSPALLIGCKRTGSESVSMPVCYYDYHPLIPFMDHAGVSQGKPISPPIFAERVMTASKSRGIESLSCIGDGAWDCGHLCAVSPTGSVAPKVILAWQCWTILMLRFFVPKYMCWNTWHFLKQGMVYQILFLFQ